MLWPTAAIWPNVMTYYEILMHDILKCCRCEIFSLCPLSLRNIVIMFFIKMRYCRGETFDFGGNHDLEVVLLLERKPMAMFVGQEHKVDPDGVGALCFVNGTEAPTVTALASLRHSKRRC
jgi:hypothetical protein